MIVAKQQELLTAWEALNENVSTYQQNVLIVVCMHMHITSLYTHVPFFKVQCTFKMLTWLTYYQMTLNILLSNILVNRYSLVLKICSEN